MEMIYDARKANLIWVRVQYLKLMEGCMVAFRNTKNAKFYEAAQEFGIKSRELKTEIESL